MILKHTKLSPALMSIALKGLVKIRGINAVMSRQSNQPCLLGRDILYFKVLQVYLGILKSTRDFSTAEQWWGPQPIDPCVSLI